MSRLPGPLYLALVWHATAPDARTGEAPSSTQAARLVGLGLLTIEGVVTPAGEAAVKGTVPGDPRKRRALALRARANEARGLLEGFDGDPARVPVDRARWDQIVRVVEQAERAAAEAEAVAAAGPRRDKSAQRAAARARRAEAVSGSTVAPDETATALVRVVACEGCGGHAELRADEHGRPVALWDKGWRSVRDTSKADWPRRWWCPSCWVEPTADDEAALPVVVRVTEAFVETSWARRGSHARRSAEALVRQLAATDPPKAEVLLQRLIYSAPTRRVGRAWREIAEEVIRS